MEQGVVSLDILPESCEGCGACCMYVGVPPFSEEELRGLDMKTLGEIRFNDDREWCPCIWLDGNKKCSRYDERPKTCRDFERGSSACHLVLGIHKQ